MVWTHAFSLFIHVWTLYNTYQEVKRLILTFLPSQKFDHLFHFFIDLILVQGYWDIVNIYFTDQKSCYQPKKLLFRFSNMCNMQIKGMSFWRISSIFTLFTYRIQLDTCFDIQIHLSLRLGTFYNSYCFFSSLHVSIIFIIAIYHYTTLALTHSVHTPRNITSGHVRLVLHKV